MRGSTLETQGSRWFCGFSHVWRMYMLIKSWETVTIYYVIRFYPTRVSGISIAPAVGQRCHLASRDIGGNNRSSVVLNRGILATIKHCYRNCVCSGKRNFHVRLLVDTVACHAVTVCKICKSACSHTIISRITLLVTKNGIFTSIWVINFPLVNFIQFK